MSILLLHNVIFRVISRENPYISISNNVIDTSVSSSIGVYKPTNTTEDYSQLLTQDRIS